MFRVAPKILSEICLPRKTKNIFDTDLFAFFLLVGHDSQNQIFNTLQWGKRLEWQQVQTAHRSHGECFNHTQVFVSELGENRYKLEELHTRRLHSYSHQSHCPTVNQFAFFFSFLDDYSLSRRWDSKLSLECETKSRSESRNYCSKSLFKFPNEKRPRTIVCWFRFRFCFEFQWPFSISSSQDQAVIPNLITGIGVKWCFENRNFIEN